MNIERILKEANEIVLDTGVLIDYFADANDELNDLLDLYIFNPNSKISLYGHNLLKAELFYIKCREAGIKQADEFLDRLDEVLIVISEKWIFHMAGKIKCKYPIALSDCFSISLSILRGCPVLFLPEEEMSINIIETMNSKLGAMIHLVE